MQFFFLFEKCFMLAFLTNFYIFLNIFIKSFSLIMISNLLINPFIPAGTTVCQKAGAGADRVRNNSLLLAEESNYRLHIECLCLQQCLSSHLI